MSEIRFVDNNMGTCVLTFDGRVAEVFAQNGMPTMRLHVLLLRIEARGPDRKDRYVVDMSPLGGGHGGVRIVIPAETYRTIEPVLAEIQAALAPAT